MSKSEVITKEQLTSAQLKLREIIKNGDVSFAILFTMLRLGISSEEAKTAVYKMAGLNHD